MDFKNVTIAGAGVLGSQIACQVALHGFATTIYARHPKTAKKRVASLQPAYQQDLKLPKADFEAKTKSIKYTDNLGEAVADADLVIEALPEELTFKREFYQKLNELAPEKTVFASNSSSLMPSQLKDATGRADRYLHLHFANQIWLRNTAEVLGSDETDPSVFDAVVDFAKQIGMLPIPLHKEFPGYVLNAMLIPWLNSALVLWAKGIADPKVIDQTWMRDLSAPIGPFGVLDAIGLKTHCNIVRAQAVQTGNPDLKLVVEKMQERIDANLLGPSTGQGFYHWPNPEFMQPDFFDDVVKK